MQRSDTNLKPYIEDELFRVQRNASLHKLPCLSLIKPSRKNVPH